MRDAFHEPLTQELLAAVVDELPTAVIIADAPSGRIIIGNKRAESHWRQPILPSGAISEYGNWEGFHLDGRRYESHEWPLARAIARGETVHGEIIRIRRGDGSIGVLRVNASPLVDASGEVIAGVTAFDDISTEHATLTKLQRLQRLGSSLLQSVTRGDVYHVIVRELSEAVGAGLTIIALLNEERSALRVVATNLASREPVDLFSTIPIDADLPMTRAVATNAPVWASTEEQARRAVSSLSKDGKVLSHRAWAALPLGRDGVVFGVISLAFDNEQQFSNEDRDFMQVFASQCAMALDRARLYESERSARREAEEANRAKDEFLAVLSHELRTPMTTILGWIDTIRLLPPEPELWELGISSMHKSAKRQERLISDLLDISRIVSGKLSMTKRPFSLMQSAVNAISQTQFLAGEKQTAVIFEPAATGDLTIHADASRIEQVLVNVLVNAIKFSPRRSTVHLRVEQLDHHAVVTIEDNGEGIDPELLPRVFDRFRQATAGYQSGLGLGLAIAKHIVERHDGRIEAHSEGLGKGATFRIELPLRSTEGSPAAN